MADVKIVKNTSEELFCAKVEYYLNNGYELSSSSIDILNKTEINPITLYQAVIVRSKRQ